MHGHALNLKEPENQFLGNQRPNSLGSLLPVSRPIISLKEAEGGLSHAQPSAPNRSVPRSAEPTELRPISPQTEEFVDPPEPKVVKLPKSLSGQSLQSVPFEFRNDDYFPSHSALRVAVRKPRAKCPATTHPGALCFRLTSKKSPRELMSNIILSLGDLNVIVEERMPSKLSCTHEDLKFTVRITMKRGGMSVLAFNVRKITQNFAKYAEICRRIIAVNTD